MEWINRPTWQQAVEVQGHRPRTTPGGGTGGGSGSGAPGTATSPPAIGGTQGAVRKKKCRHAKRRSAQAAKKRRCHKKRR
jgi:hypothetical protein